MSSRRADASGDRQVPLAWSTPRDILEAVESRPGAVVFEVPEISRIVSGRQPSLPRVRVRRRGPVEPPSLGLPFGVRDHEGRQHCWSCGRDLSEDDVIRSAPGYVQCPGCGARLPFAE